MDARRQSLAFSLAAGAAIGSIALAARYAPGWRRDPPRVATAEPSLAAIAPSEPPTSSIARASDAAPTPNPPTPSAPAVDTDAPPIAPPAWAARFDDDPAARAACPADMTLVEGSFCPDLRYTCVRRSEDAGHRCAEYARGARCRGEPDPRRYCVDRYEWPNRLGEAPLVYVDWFEAKALCASAGKRLCRRSEWILACEGPKRLPYPWGFVRTPSPCNIDRAAIPFDIPALVDERTRKDELARLWQADRIGTHPDCVSAYGAWDMSGNVDEWTDDEADDPGSPNPSTLNGGYWGPVRDTCRLTTKSHGPTFRFYQVGFRCCADTIDGVPVPPPRPWVDPTNERRDDAGGADPYSAAE